MLGHMHGDNSVSDRCESLPYALAMVARMEAIVSDPCFPPAGGSSFEGFVVAHGADFGSGMLNAPAPYCVDCNSEYHVDNFDLDCPSCGKPLSKRSAKMSKSLGNTVSPEEMISRFGADTVRLFILFGANPEAGMDWSDSALEANHRQMFSLIDAVDAALEFSDSPSKIDGWLMSRMRVNQKKWIEAMSEVSLREGVMVSHFEMLTDWHWYLRRGGCDRLTAMKFLEGWIPMLAPATPHIAEEFWRKIEAIL